VVFSSNYKSTLVLTFLVVAIALVAHAQTISPDGSSITPSSGGSLVTSDGTWTFGTSSLTWGTQILLNGQPASTGYGNEILISGEKVYAEVGGNAPGWYVWQGGAWVSTTEPQNTRTSSCTGSLIDYYTSAVATPTGYGASYDLFSSQHELEVSVQNCPNNSLTLTVGSNLSNQYIYNKGYVYQSGSWQPINLTSTNTLISSAWYPDLASAALSVDPSSWVYVVGYVCSWNGQLWQCGCATTACTTNYWQLQAFQTQSSGGSSNGSGAGGQWGGTPDANAIVIAPNGNDSNPCTVNSPCQTLERAQQVARSASDKTVYLRAGTYNRSQTLTLDSNDNGETWMTYPGDPVNSAIIDGGNTISPFAMSGSFSNFTWNGIKVQNCATTCFVTTDSTLKNALVWKNSEFANIGAVNCVEGTPCAAIATDNCTNCVYSHNYVHNLEGFGIEMLAYNAGDSINGSVITGNVVTDFCQVQSDCGGIYTNMNGTGSNGGSISIANNFVRDGGSPSLTNDVIDVYLDDKTSNATVNGNVLAPPCAGCLNAGNTNNSTAVGINNDNTAPGSGVNNTVTGNILDIGNSSYFSTVIGGTTNTTIKGNIVLSNFTGPLHTVNCAGTGFPYCQSAGGTSGYTIASNDYYNYASDGSIFSNGNIVSDSDPINVDPQISGYTVAQGSPVFSQINFQPIQGGWGPPGFVIPSSTNHSNP
jgi:hypothetical protein